ncbi:MAG: hypothetical protein RL595_1888 [Planctomycetota bacterium]|jgi:hypothetical protein
MVEKGVYKHRDRPEALDFLVGAIGLCFIVCMMVSFSFFLLARASLSSNWTSAHWLVFWEILGTVLVCRMFLTEGLQRVAGRYAFVFGMVSWIPFAGFAVMNGEMKVASLATIFMAVVGLLTYKITWDVTDLGERLTDEDGYLASVGIKRELNPGAQSVSDSWGDTREITGDYNFEAEEVLSDLANQKKAKPKKPTGSKGRGVWVLYFLLASVPVFGLAGGTSGSSDPKLPGYYALCLGVYLGSCAGLLMTTCFLTVRKDLRRRHLGMPLFTSMFWMISGGLVLALCFMVAFVLPRPQGITDPVSWVASRKHEKNASDYAQNSRDAGKGQGPAGEKKGENGSIKQGSGKEGESQKSKGEKGKGSGTEQKHSASKNKTSSDDSKSDSSKSVTEVEPNYAPSIDIPGLQKIMGFVELLIKVVVGIGTFLFVIYVFIFKMSFHLEWAYDLLAWLRELFNLDKKERKAKEKMVSQELVEEPESAGFYDYSNPFQQEGWQKISLKQLTGYTWKALLAWCQQRKLSVPEGCTPGELQTIISDGEPRLEPAYYAFSQVLLQVQYGSKTEIPKGVDAVQKIWHMMEN